MGMYPVINALCIWWSNTTFEIARDETVTSRKWMLPLCCSGSNWEANLWIYLYGVLSDEESE